MSGFIPTHHDYKLLEKEIEKIKADIRDTMTLLREKDKTIIKLTRQRDKYLEALREANEFTSSVFEDLEHYYDNKCIPTADEVNQASIADSNLRYVIGKALQEAEESKNDLCKNSN